MIFSIIIAHIGH